MIALLSLALAAMPSGGSSVLERLGDDEVISVDVRVIAATKHDLRKEVERGKFREDLFFRLSVVPVAEPEWKMLCRMAGTRA